MASFADSNKAAQTLSTLIGSTIPGVLSVGVGRNDKDFWVQVSITQNTDTKAIPLIVDGIPVKVIVREMPKAL